MRSALAAFLFVLIYQQAAGRPTPLLPGHRHLMADTPAPNSAFEFEAAAQANTFLRKKRDKRPSSTEQDKGMPSFLPPKERLQPVNPKLRPKKIKAKAERPPTTKPTACFPGSDSSALSIPTTAATFSSLQDWFCPHQEEYAFMGFR